MKFVRAISSFLSPRRTPQGVRGLKFPHTAGAKRGARSHPARGAWIEIGYKPLKANWTGRRTPQGVRGLKFDGYKHKGCFPCRTPQGVRGLKLAPQEIMPHVEASHPARGAWIEIGDSLARAEIRRGRTPQGVRGLKCRTRWCRPRCWASRTPQGVRGLKSPRRCLDRPCPGRTPQGVRGLKSELTDLGAKGVKSHPARGAWIEITAVLTADGDVVSHPARGAWIEMLPVLHATGNIWSHPARGAWIEMHISTFTGGESPRRTPQGVRGLKYEYRIIFYTAATSHPARGAWIEISTIAASISIPAVAPRKGCVD